MSWLTDTLFATGALIVLVLVLRRPVSRWFGPGMAYALWALPLLRLIIPPLVLPAEQAPVAFLIAEAETAAEPFVAVAAEPQGWALSELVIVLWIVGSLGFIAWRVWGYLAMRRRLLSDARPVGEVGPIRLIETPATPTPVAFGLTDKVVALPLGFMASEDRIARDLAIAHELEHHAGRDIAVNFAMQPLLALHWFNPLAWLGWRAMRRDQEAACDARVLAGRCAETRAAYGRLIADFAQGPRLSLAAPLACPVVGEKSIIHRLRSLTMDQPTRRRRLMGRLLIGAGALALPLTASISYATSDPAAPAPEVKVEKDVKVSKKVIIVDHRDGASPDDPKLHTRTIERDGKTIILKTAQPLSDAEAEEKIAKAEASMAEAHTMAEGGKHGPHRVMLIERHNHEGGKEAEVHRTESRVVVHSGGEGGPHATAIALGGEHPEVIACAGGAETTDVSAEENKDGKRQSVKLKFCSRGGTPAMALDALKKARDKMSTNTELSDEIRAKVLEQLDREIERLSRTS